MIPSWAVDLLVVGLSIGGSFWISRWTVNSRIENERDREVENWYIEAGRQANLATSEYSNEILSETSTGNEPVDVFRERAREIEEHAAKGEYIGVDKEVRAALGNLASAFRKMASEIESDGNIDIPALTELEDGMWGYSKLVSNKVSEEVEYDTRSEWMTADDE